MRRLLFVCLVAVSLLLCVATLVIWAVAQRFPVCHVSFGWNDMPTGVVSVTTAKGWDADGFFAVRNTDVYLDDFDLQKQARTDPDMADFAADRHQRFVLARGKLEAISPPRVPSRYFAREVPDLSKLGHYFNGTRDESGTVYSFASIATGFAVLPVIWTVAAIVVYLSAKRRKRVGCCALCGYDLRASPQRCPECGAPAAAVDTATLDSAS